MLYHVSRRTDVPGCYWEWFLRRLDAGYALVRNPYYPEKVSRYELGPDVCDGFAFLSKSYGPALRGVDGLPSLEEIVGTYRVTTFSCTLTPYLGLERGLPPFEERAAALGRLSAIAGRERMSWFLAPVLATEEFDVAYHLTFLDTVVPHMARLCSSCMVDEVNVYPEVGRRAPFVRRLLPSERDEVFGRLGELASTHGLELRCCPGALGDRARFGFVGRPCADRAALGDANGVTISRGQTERCGCVMMRDLGAYAPCPHGCAYCYARPGIPASYDPFSEMLCDSLRGDEVVRSARQVSLCA